MVAPEWVVQHPHSARERGATNRAHGIFKGRHFEATLILQVVSWDLRYPLSSRDIEELFLERGLEVDHSTLSHWVERFALRQCVQTRLHMIAVAKVIANSDPHQMH